MAEKSALARRHESVRKPYPYSQARLTDAIGQFEVAATPLQMAVVAGAIAPLVMHDTLSLATVRSQYAMARASSAAWPGS